MAPGAAGGQIGCRCGACAPYFLGVFPLLCLLTPSVEADEAVFKGVQMLPITLGFACLSHCLSVYHAHWSGRYTPAA